MSFIDRLTGSNKTPAKQSWADRHPDLGKLYEALYAAAEAEEAEGGAIPPSDRVDCSEEKFLSLLHGGVASAAVSSQLESVEAI